MGGRQTFEDIALDRHHPPGTAAKTIDDARPGSICPAEDQGSNKAGGVLALAALSVEGDTDIGLVTATAGVAGTVWTVCGPVTGGVLLARKLRDDYPDRRVGPRLCP